MAYVILPARLRQIHPRGGSTTSAKIDIAGALE
jgi:hypothetical protein